MHLNGSRRLERYLKFTSMKWSEMHLFIVVGENFEVYMSEMARNEFKLSIMVGENFEICISETARNAFKLSTMVVENFEIYIYEMARMHINCPPWLEKILKFRCLKWLERH